MPSVFALLLDVVLPVFLVIAGTALALVTLPIALVLARRWT